MKFKSKWIAPLAAVLLLAACSEEATTDETKKSTPVAVEKAADPYTVVDDRGVEVTFDAVPETIVSLQPSNTEILFSLGVGEKIVGATDYDTYPKAAQSIERVASTVSINTERIVELNPDVVVAYTIGEAEQITQLEDAGLKVFVIQSATSFDDVYTDIVQLSEVMGVEATGDQLVTDIQAQIAAVQAKTATVEAPKRVYYEISPSPDIWTTGSATFQQEIFVASNVENIFADQQSWLSVTEEDVITRNPELIMTTVNYMENPTDEILSRAGWETIQAIVNKEVYLIDGDIMSRPATRIGEAVELVAKTVYPDLFK